jgi:hypothetical protein
MCDPCNTLLLQLKGQPTWQAAGRQPIVAGRMCCPVSDSVPQCWRATQCAHLPPDLAVVELSALQNKCFV